MAFPDRRSGQDRRAQADRREGQERRKQDASVAVNRRKGERRKGERRRQVDPTTCEKEYTADQLEFMNAIEQYKRRYNRQFPTLTEVLEVLQKLGYVKMPQQDESTEDEAPTVPVEPMIREQGSRTGVRSS